jgi:drug/metabolite transporter (DMT)-like permease
MKVPNDLYTAATLFTLTGSAAAVWAITSVIGYLLELKESRRVKKWLGLVLSLGLALIGASQVQASSALTWTVGIVNGFLIYLTAVGANTVTAEAAHAKRTPESPVRETGRRRKRGSFTEPWW